MNSLEPHVSIIMLNWNGWKDTIECLFSILKMTYQNFSLILIDNHSTDNSVQKIRNWAKQASKNIKESKFPEFNDLNERKKITLLEADTDNILPGMSSVSKSIKIVIIKNSDNKGFAKATNQGMHVAKNLFQSKYYYLLNNDTVVDKNTLAELVNVMENNPQVGLAQSIIFEYGNKDSINNVGGRIFFWGQTKYYKSYLPGEIRTITFINGCALFARAKTLRDFGYLSEKFFFGEEDFELSMRMNRNRIKMVCCTKSKVYHKVAIASQKYFNSDRKKAILHFLNRMVDMKFYYPRSIWHLWKIFVLFYFLLQLLISYRATLIEAISMFFRMNYFATKLNEVSKEAIETVYRESGM
jgi:GT2 family glycosyltransferase